MLRLQWFIHVRWVMVGFAAAALIVERLTVAGAWRPTGLYVVVILVALVNVVWMITSRLLSARLQASPASDDKPHRVAQLFANAQVGVDLVLLTLILRYTGGVENPMFMFYVFHIAIGAFLVSTWQALLHCVWAIALFAVLGVGELRGWIAPHYPLLPSVVLPSLHLIPAFVAVAVLILASGVLGTFYLTQRVASRLEERERQLRQALAGLQASEAAIRRLQQRRSRFMQTAAHQLKSPLTGIQMLAGLIRDDIVKEAAVKGTAEKVVRRCQEGLATVTELLTLARLQDADPSRHDQAMADVVAVVREVCQRRDLQAKHAGLTLSCDAPAGEKLAARIDRMDLADCVDNLVENAIKYTPAGGKVCVTAGRRSPSRSTRPQPLPGREGDVIALSWPEGGPELAGEQVFVSVQDTGMGIDPKELTGKATLFDSFRRGVGALTAGIPGSGLGLSIVRMVIEQAGGRIEIATKPEEGSTFTIVFPAAAAATAGAARPATAPESAAEATWHSSKNERGST